jgi:hypothetical protein
MRSSRTGLDALPLNETPEFKFLDSSRTDAWVEIIGRFLHFPCAPQMALIDKATDITRIERCAQIPCDSDLIAAPKDAKPSWHSILKR